MNGEFDEKLTRPFRGKIKIQLLDLINERGIFTPTIHYSAEGHLVDHFESRLCWGD